MSHPNIGDLQPDSNNNCPGTGIPKLTSESQKNLLAPKPVVDLPKSNNIFATKLNKKIKRKSAELSSTSQRENIRKKMKTRISSKKAAVVSNEASKDSYKCSVCNQNYSQRQDNGRYGQWIGCENSEHCGTWVHRKCIGWTEEQVDTDSYYCPSCKE